MNRSAVIIVAFLFTWLLFFPALMNSRQIDILTRETLNDNIRRVDNVDEDGSLITNPATGYATVIQVLDKEHHPIEEHYFDENGRSVERVGGYYGIRRVYEGVYCTQYTYLGIDNNPVCSSSGYASVIQVYNNEGQVSEVYYLDEVYQPVALSTGQYGEFREYNSVGQNYKSTFINQNGNPVENSMGYSMVLRDYTPEGLVDIEWYYNLAGEQISIGQNRYGSKMVYKNGVYISWIPVDTSGNVVFNFDTFMQNNPWLIGVVAVALIILALLLPKKIMYILLATYIVFILIMTLLHRESGDLNHNFNLFWSYRQIFQNKNLAIQVLSNIWLFIPLGAMLASIKKETWVIFIGVGLSVLIELTQLVFGLGLCEFDDIISNSLGSWLGFSCFCECMIWKSKMVKADEKGTFVA